MCILEQAVPSWNRRFMSPKLPTPMGVQRAVAASFCLRGKESRAEEWELWGQAVLLGASGVTDRVARLSATKRSPTTSLQPLTTITSPSSCGAAAITQSPSHVVEYLPHLSSDTSPSFVTCWCFGSQISSASWVQSDTRGDRKSIQGDMFASGWLSNSTRTRCWAKGNICLQSWF